MLRRKAVGAGCGRWIYRTCTAHPPGRGCVEQQPQKLTSQPILRAQPKQVLQNLNEHAAGAGKPPPTPTTTLSNPSVPTKLPTPIEPELEAPATVSKNNDAKVDGQKHGPKASVADRSKQRQGPSYPPIRLSNQQATQSRQKLLPSSVKAQHPYKDQQQPNPKP